MNPLKCPKCQSDNPADTRFCGNCAAPLEGETPLSIVMKHKGETPKDPRELNAQVPQDQSRVILRCLEKEKAKRYQSADELHTDLEKIEKGIPTTERVPMRKPLTSREITVKFSLRKLSIPAFILMAVVLGALIIWRLVPKKQDWLILMPFLETT